MKQVWLLLAIAIGCGTAPPPSAPTTETASRIARIEHGLGPRVQVADEEVRHDLAARMRELKIPAISIAVFEHHELQWAKAYGLADVEHGIAATTETLFQAGSISKSGNALAVLMAVADGTLKPLDTPINEQLAGWKLPDHELTKTTPVTLRMLLSHTGGTTVHGFPGYATGTPVPTLVQVLDGLPPANTPPIRVEIPTGTYRYSGGGTTITQLALVEHSKQPYEDVLATRVLRPLGMAHSTYAQPLPPDRIGEAAAGYLADGTVVPGLRHVYPEQAAAGLWTTPSDLVRLFSEISLARAGRSRIVTKEIATQMTTKVADSQGPNSVGLGVFMFTRDGVKVFGHDGADEGFQAVAMAGLDDGFGVIVMANSDNGGQIFDEIVRAVFAEYGWGTPEAPLVRFALTAEQRAAFAGAYQAGGFGPIVIVDRAGTLELGAPFGKRPPLVPIAADTLVGVNGERLRIDANGGLAMSLEDTVVATLPRIASDAKHPLLELAAGRFDDAVTAWKARVAADPKTAQQDESWTNGYGYQLLDEDPASAVLVLRLVAAVFPDSSNSHDSLGEVYMRTNDTAHAIAEYELALSTLDADPRMPAEAKVSARAHAISQLAILRAKK